MGNCCGVARGEEDPGKIKVQPKELGKAKPETNDVEAKDIEVDKITNDASKTVDIENEDPEEIQPDIQLPGTPKEPEIREQETKKSDPVSYVLFFPDERMPCRAVLTGQTCKYGANCHFAHEPTTLTKLLDLLNNTKKSMDICLYTITCNEICDAIIGAHIRRVKVRIVTDDAQRNAKGSCINRMKAKGVNVRDDGKPNDYMHHKFAILDGTTVLNGSFNWTRHAVLGNFENIVVSTDERLCRQFTGEFERLWAAFSENTQF